MSGVLLHWKTKGEKDSGGKVNDKDVYEWGSTEVTAWLFGATWIKLCFFMSLHIIFCFSVIVWQSASTLIGCMCFHLVNPEELSVTITKNSMSTVSFDIHKTDTCFYLKIIFKAPMWNFSFVLFFWHPPVDKASDLLDDFLFLYTCVMCLTLHYFNSQIYHSIRKFAKRNVSK